MMTAAMVLCLAALVAATLMALWRLLTGPGILDRIIAFDLTALSIVGMMALISVWWKTQLFIEIMMIFSLLGFVGTVAFVAYLHNNPSKLTVRPRGRQKSGKPPP